MQKFTFPLLVLVILTVAACQQAKPVGPNVYQAPGSRVFTLADDFKYSGSPEVSVSTYCVRNCRPLQSDSRVKAYADVYVSSPDGIDPMELFVFERDVFKEQRVYWAPPSGEQVEFGGKIYLERFYFYEFGSGAGFSVIENHLNEAGFKPAGPGMLIYSATRNLSARTRLTILYALSLKDAPAGILKDSEKIKSFMRDSFVARIVDL